MAAAEFVSEATVRGRLYQIDWYPGLVLDADGDEIHGDLFAVDDETLGELDAFEGVGGAQLDGLEYHRVQAATMRKDSTEVAAWVWEWIGPVDESRRVADGDWLKFA